MRVLLAAGGTGGHLYPGIALARTIQAEHRGDEVTFIGTPQGMEARVLAREGYAFEAIRIEGLLGRGLPAQARTLLRLPAAVWAARGVIRRCRPDVVIGVGGYVSGPVVIAAAASAMTCRRVLLEPNAIPGLTNRWLAPVSDCVVTAFEAARPYFGPAGRKVVEVLGTPVRPEVASTREARQAFSHRQRTLLIVGGSQGARTLNQIMIAALEDLKDLNLAYVHQTGDADWAMVRDAYRRRGALARVEPFVEDMADVYRVANLAVSRAGGTTVAELTVVGLPAILVPYPHATHGHQEHNARLLVEAGAAEMIREDDLTGPALAAAVRRLLEDHDRLDGMAARSRALGRPDAAGRIVARCRALVESRKAHVHG